MSTQHDQGIQSTPTTIAPSNQQSSSNSILQTISLIEATQRLSQTGELPTLLFNIVNGIHLLGFDRVRLYTISPDKKFMNAVAQKGMQPDFVSRQFLIKGDPIYEELDGNATLFLRNRVAGQPEPYEEILGKEGVDQFVYMPLTCQKQLEGLIVADNKESNRTIEKDELPQLAIYTAHAAIALRNQLEQEGRLSAEWKANKYGAMQAIFAAINSRSSLHDIFELACEAAFDLFDVDHVGMVTFENNFSTGQVVAEFPKLGLQGFQLPTTVLQFERKLLSDLHPIVLTDVSQVEGIDTLRDVWMSHDIRSLLIAPVVINEEVVGSFSLDAIGRKRPFTMEELELSQLFASQLAVAIHNSQLLHESEERNRQLTSLTNTTLALTSQNNRDALLEEIVQHAVELLKGRGGGIKRYYPDRGYLEVITVFGDSKDLLTTTVPIGQGMAGKIIQENLPYYFINNYPEWEGKHENLPETAQTESMVMAAMKWQDETIGVIYVEDELAHEFNEHDAQKLKLFADQAAIAFCTADLVERNSAKASRLQQLTKAINEIMQQLDSMPLEERLDLIAKHAACIIQAEACGISLVQKAKLVYQAGYGYRADSVLHNIKLPIVAGAGIGLSSYIASEQKLFNESGEQLKKHFAVNGSIKPQTKSGECYSLLAIPLMHQFKNQKALIGLLRIENKKNKDGEPDPYARFTEEDEHLLQLFADAISVAVESAQFVTEIQEKQEHYHQLIDVSPTGIISNNRAGIIEHVNQKACDLLGYTREELVGGHVREIFDNPTDVYQIQREIMRAPSYLLTERHTYLVGKNTNIIPIKLAATQLQEDGRVIGTIGYFEDLREVQDVRARTDLLLAVTKTLMQASDLNKGLDEFAKMVVANWNVSFCRICLLDKTGQELTVRAIQTHSDLSLVEPKRHLGSKTAVSNWGNLDTVIAKLDSHLLHKHNEKTAQELHKYANRLGYGALQSLLVIPLKTRNRECVGIMILGNLTTMPEPEFDKHQIRLARAIGNQTAGLIERSQLLHESRRREKLLEYLNDGLEQIKAIKEHDVLLHEACRLAATLSRRNIGGLFKNKPYKGEFVLEAISGLNKSLLGQTVKHDEGLLKKLLETGESQSTNRYGDKPNQEKIFKDQNLETVVFVPLKTSDGQIEAVLFVADRQKPHLIDNVDLEILEKFAAQVSIALKTASLLDKDTRHLSRINLLHEISTQIQIENNLDLSLNLVLTGITAGYGLGFNRAAIYLYNSINQKLEGRAGVGHRLEENNYLAWEEYKREGPYNLQEYRQKVTREGVTLMSLGKDVKGQHFSVDLSGSDLFSTVHNQRQWRIVEEDDFHRLPPQFKQIFMPTTPIVIVPMVIGEKALGILVADKKFTQDPIGDEEIDLLNTFANTTAIVVENQTLLEEAQRGQKHLNTLFQAGNQLKSIQEPEDVAQSIVDLGLKATTAVCVRMILIKQLDKHTQKSYIATNSPELIIDYPIRENGLSIHIQKTGQYLKVPDVAISSLNINPSFNQRHIKAAIGFPISTEHRQMGVIWFYYDKTYYFNQAKINALHAYANQAALAYDNATHIAQSEKMWQAAQSLSSVHNLSDIKTKILEGAQNVLNADDAALWIYNQPRNQFLTKESVATFPQRDWSYFALDEPRQGGTAEHVLKHHWIGVKDVSNHKKYRFLAKSTRDHLQKMKVKSFQGICLGDEQETLAILYANYSTRQAFTDDDKQAIKTFAHHATLALKNAQQLEHQIQIQHTAKILASITTLENNLGDVNGTLTSVASGTKTILDCDAVTIFVYEPKRQKIHFPPTHLGLIDSEKVEQLTTLGTNSLVHKMLAYGKRYLVDDVFTDPYFKSSLFRRKEKIQSVAAVPLKVADTQVGIIFANYRTPHRFTQSDTDILEMFADQAAIAIYNAQLYNQVQRQEQAVYGINDAIHTISTSEDIDSIFNAICQQAVRITGEHGLEARYAHLVLHNELGNLTLSGIYPPENLSLLKKTVDEINIRRSEKIGIVGQAILNKKPFLAEDVDKYPDDYIALHKETKSNLAVPIIDHHNDVIGVINVEHSDCCAFDEQDEIALQILAKHASVAIEKAKSRERELRQLNALTAIDKAVHTLNQTFDLNEILNTIAEQAMNLTGLSSKKARVSYIGLVRGNNVRFKATYPHDELENLLKKHNVFCIDPNKVDRIGTIGRTVMTKTPQLIPDVRESPDYIKYQASTLCELCVPILEGNEVIGIIIVDHPEIEAFDEADVQALSTLAEHAAIAIRTANLYRDMKSVADINRQAATSLKLAPLIKQICQKIDSVWSQETITSIRLFDKQKSVLYFAHDWYEAYAKLIGDQFSREHYQRLDQGICGLVASTKKPYHTGDSTQAKGIPNPFWLISNTRSELCVPILDGDNQALIGVLDIQSPELNLFSAADERTFKNLANQIAVAIRKAQAYEELEDTKGKVGASTALAWMGMANSVWQHSLVRDASTIRNVATVLNSYVEKLARGERLEDKIHQKLQTIIELSGKILDKPITPPLSAEEGVSHFDLNSIIRERLVQLWEKDMYKAVDGPLVNFCKEDAIVFSSPVWIRLALDMLLDNAVEAMQHSLQKQINIFTEIKGGFVYLGIQDTGHGFSDEARESCFTGRLKTTKDGGHLGRGLLMVQAIVSTYGGEVDIGDTSSSGTIMIIKLPLSDKGLPDK